MNTFPMSVEQFICTNEGCEAQIRGDHIISKIDERNGERHVRALCHACGRMHEAHYRLGPVGWEIIGKVEIVTAANRISGFKARIDHNLQIASATAA